MEKTTSLTDARMIRRLPLVVIAVIAAVGAIALGDSLSFEALARHREALIAFRDENYLVTAFGFVVGYALIVALSLPGATVATLTGGFLFGLFPGTLLNVVAATGGATMIFLAARWGAGEWLAARMDAGEGLVHRIKQGIDRNQWSMLFLIRLVPAVPFFVANLVPALVAVPLARYVVSTALGIVPGALVYTSVGRGLGEVFARGGTPDLDILFEPQVLAPLLGLCALAALPIALRAVRGRSGL